MKKRRDFIKAVAAGTGALACNKVVGAPIGATIIPGTSYLLLSENQIILSGAKSATLIVATAFSTGSNIYGSAIMTVAPNP